MAVMRRSSFGFALVAVVLIVVVGSASGTPNTNLVSSTCTTQKISRESAFFHNLGALLAVMKENTALISGFDLYQAVSLSNPMHEDASGGGGGSGTGPPGWMSRPGTAYGQANCNQLLSRSDCTACLSNLVAGISVNCSNAVGARVQLTDCFIRYEQYSF